LFVVLSKHVRPIDGVDHQHLPTGGSRHASEVVAEPARAGDQPVDVDGPSAPHGDAPARHGAVHAEEREPARWGVEGYVRDIVADIVEKGEFDLVHDAGAVLPLRVKWR
jgi:hypothetical protein